MREILFRGKDKKTGEWFYGNYYDKDTSNRAHIKTVQKGSLDIEAETVGQFTGLLDKNGRKIFEGDIISIALSDRDKVGRLYAKTNFPDQLNSVVTYNERRCCYELIFQKNENGLISCEIGWYGENFSIVGNIHDNPELLSSNL